ncbi:MAG: glycosyltransferase family 39 protein [Solirubrobacterales bacterium]|nr:glycosyltransferase family 39 protein [Solirubrobacterales bacterium]
MLVPARSDAAVAARTSRALRVASTSVEAWLLAGVIVVGAGLRFATLGAQSYWFDEAQAAHELHLSLGAMFHSIFGVETNPPLYFVVGWVWVHVFGAGEVGLRSLSALAGTAVVVLAYLCGRELVSREAGLLAAALAALSPFMIWYSQEAREYMLLAAMCGASMLFWARAWHEPSRWNIVGWGTFSALALLTHSFAVFLVVPEALWLLYVIRTRTIAIAVGLVAAVQVALLPIAFNHATSNLLGFISATPLNLRIQDVPVVFAIGTPYDGQPTQYGLLGAAALAALVIPLLVIGADSRQLRGAGASAALAGTVILIPLGLALLGEDYFIQRALIPAWLPLAVVVGTACTARRARIAGGALAVVLLAGCVYIQVHIDGNHQYQRPDWRGVATALGSTPPGGRAIVAYDGQFAQDPLAIYLPGVAWTQTGSTTVNVGEIDVIGHAWQQVGKPLPGGVRLIGTKLVNDFLVARFAVAPARRLGRPQIAGEALSLLGPASGSGTVLLQRPG